MVRCNRKKIFVKLWRISGLILIIMLLAGSLDVTFIPLKAYASTTIRQGNKIVITNTSESLVFDGYSHESTVYAGEIKRNGETVLNYLFSDDVTRSSVIFDNLRKALPNPYSDMVPSVVQQQTEKGLKEMSAATVNNINLSTLSGDWKEAASIAAQIYQGKNTSDAKNELMYDASEECRSNIDKLAHDRVENLDNPVATNKRVISHVGIDTIDSVSYTRVDGGIIETHNVNLTYLSEATSLIYTTVNVVDTTASRVTKAPQAKDLTFNGQAQVLVTTGEAEAGTMQYALGNDAVTVPATGWGTSVPTATNAGTYYVWYKAKGDDGYTDSEAAYVEAKINSPEPWKSSIKNDSTLPEAEKDKAYDVTFELEDSTITDLNWEVTKDSLPEGLSLDSKIGKLSGTPSKAGEYTFTIREKTSGAEKEFSLTVRSGEEPGPEPGPEPEPSAGIRNDSILPEAKQDADYDVTLELKDSSVQDTDWIVTDGSLPEGLSLDSRTGKISGKPAKEGEYEFTIKESKTGAEKKFNLTVASSGSKKEEKRSSKHDTEEHKTASWILNPNEKQQLVITFTGTPAYLTAGYQEQGAAAAELFKAAVPAGWVKAFSFNMLDQKRQPDLSVKNGTLTLSIPGEYIKAGRQFALLGMNKAGQVILFADMDNNPNTVTVNLANMDGYAFNLIYRD